MVSTATGSFAKLDSLIIEFLLLDWIYHSIRIITVLAQWQPTETNSCQPMLEIFLNFIQDTWDKLRMKSMASFLQVSKKSASSYVQKPSGRFIGWCHYLAKGCDEVAWNERSWKYLQCGSLVVHRCRCWLTLDAVRWWYLQGWWMLQRPALKRMNRESGLLSVCT